MKKVEMWIVIVLASISTVIMVTYGSARYGESFFSGFLSNWYSTFLGVIIGVPIVMWATNLQEAEIEKERKKQVLESIRSELEENKGRISQVYDGDGGLVLDMDVLSFTLRDEVWVAFSEGGELKWIKDPLLLKSLADSYGAIRKVKYLADKYIYVTNFKRSWLI